jgi:acyl-CoA reductase-like NAD-dependent aldehyde dehydrogenase
VLPGKGSVVGQRFVDNPGVNKVVFTGSTEVGKAVMAGCAAQVKPVTLELGGKSANIVFADADLEQAAATAPYAVFDNAGQDCCARSRILVQRSVFDRFLELLEPAVKGVRVEDPALDTAEMGPLITAGSFFSMTHFWMYVRIKKALITIGKTIAMKNNIFPCQGILASVSESIGIRKVKKQTNPIRKCNGRRA